MRYLAQGTNKVALEDVKEAVEIAFTDEDDPMGKTVIDLWREEGRQKGYAEGLEDGIERGVEIGMRQMTRQALLANIRFVLEYRFGQDGLELYREVDKIRDNYLLERIQRMISSAQSLEEIRTIYQQPDDSTCS